MNELIQVAERHIGDGTIQTVNARDLHAFLEVGKDFSTWIKGRIEQYGFVENQDFVTFDAAPQNGGAGNRGHRVEYAISLDMAKELAMVERNDKGKQARQFSWVKQGTNVAKLTESKESERFVLNVVANTARTGYNNLRGVQYFYAHKQGEPAWANKMVCSRIEDHTFCREKR